MNPLSLQLMACLLTGFLTGASLATTHFTSAENTAVKFGVHEIVMTGNGQVANPFDTVATVQFTPPSGESSSKTVWAFYDGENTWRARVYLSEIGQWSWRSTCKSDTKLHGQSGQFSCEPSNLRGRLLAHPKNPRQWITEDGRYFLNLSDTAYFLLCARDGNGDAVSDEQARQYVRDDVSRGITSVRCFLANGPEGFAESSKQWQAWYFSNASLDRLRLENLQCADRRLRMLLDEFPDVALQLIMFPLEAYARDDRFWTALSAAQRERLLRNLVARFAAYPQLFWLMTNDAHYGEKYPNSNAMVREVGTYLQKHDLWQHPRSTGHARKVPFYFGNEGWVNYIHIEHEHDLGAREYAKYHSFAKPVFLGEDRYEQDHGPSRDPLHMGYWQRRLFWSWLFSGGSTNYGGRWWAVHPYGETGDRTSKYNQRSNVTFKTALTGLDCVIPIRDYFEKRAIDLALFEPDHSLVKDPAGAEKRRAPKLMRRGRVEFLLYHPNAVADGHDANVHADRNARVRIDLRSADGSFAVEWYRAHDGIAQEGALVAGGDDVELVAPWLGHDVVLRLIRIGKDASETDHTSESNKLVEPPVGPLRVHPDNPRYFTDGSGKAVYLTGSHPWHNFQDMGVVQPPARFDYDAYLAFLDRHGHNFIRLWRYELTEWTGWNESQPPVRYTTQHPWKRTGPGNALDGLPKFDFSQWDDSYFERLRSRVDAAQRRGIYVSIMLFEGWCLRIQPSSWSGHPLNASNNVSGINGDVDNDGQGLEVQMLQVPAITELQKAYIRRVIDAVNDLDNVLYEISNESLYTPEILNWQLQLVHYINEYQSTKPQQHPVGITNLIALDNQSKLASNESILASPADWISPGVTIWGPKDPYSINPPTTTGKKVEILDSDHTWNNACMTRTSELRADHAWVWKSFLRGYNPIYMDPLDLSQPDGVMEYAKANAYAIVLARPAMGHTRAYAERMNLAAMTPRSELASTQYCLANPGKEYLVYLPFGGEVKVNLVEAQTSLAVEWFNPRTGEKRVSESVAGGAQRSFRSPFAGDAVLYLHRLAKIFAKPGDM